MIAKVNGRTRYFAHLENFRLVSRRQGHYSVQRGGVTYHITGGRNAGGSPRDWFVECAEWNRPIFCNSLMDSLNMLDNM
jgi:hypothetical protein